MTSHELKPVQKPYSPEVEGILKNYPNRDGYILTLFRVFANSVRFLKKGTVNLLDRESPLSMREREIVILRVCANNRCEYEWGVHVTAFSEHVELSPEQILATLEPQPADFSERERLLLSVVDDLCGAGSISDEHYERFQVNWTCEQQLEVMSLCGNYHTICFVANSTRLEPEPFAARFPDTLISGESAACAS